MRDTNGTAVITQSIRSWLFPSDVEGALAKLAEQRFVAGLSLWGSGDQAAQLLHALQSTCRDQALLDDTSIDWLHCDLIRIDWGTLHSDASIWSDIIECTDEALTEMVERGDLEPYANLPRRIQRKAAGTTLEPMYLIHETSKFNEALFGRKTERGPLPLINKKLNIIGRQLGLNQTDLFQDDSTFGPFGNAPITPDGPKRHIKMTNRNHHWDILFRCDPQSVHVTFYIKSTRRSPQLWWEVDLKWERISERINYYKGHADIRVGSFYTQTTIRTKLMVVLCLSYYLLCFLPPAIQFILSILRTILAFIGGNESEFHRWMIYLKGSTAARRPLPFVPLIQLLFESAGSLCFLLGLLLGGFDLYSTKGRTSIHRGFESTISAIQAWKEAGITGWDLFFQVCHGLFCTVPCYAVALTLWFMRSLDISLMSKRTSFLVTTFALAVAPLLHFLLIFSIVVLCYSAILYMQFGQIYPQFASIRQSLWCMLLYAFSFTNASMAEDQVFPFIEDGAYFLQLLLLSFQVIVVTILLNMFTTIVLDAYSVALGIEDGEENMEKDRFSRDLFDAIVNSWGWRVGKPGELRLRELLSRTESPRPDSPRTEEKTQRRRFTIAIPRDTTTLADLKDTVEDLATQLHQFMNSHIDRGYNTERHQRDYLTPEDGFITERVYRRNLGD